MQYQDMIVIDELRVGPVRVEPRRVETLYTVTIDGERHENTLIYSYGEAVFEPATAASQNLASMITAQLALNYGLFCRRIVFDGLFDREDKRFLRIMMENTSKEIFINKLLRPNPFLTGPVTRLPAEKHKRYTNAELVFENTAFDGNGVEWNFWPVKSNQYCVLSSGGKDSLLSYGLLSELGASVHPIFGNESGRHWFTALNGYRHLKANDPHTAKVWMNSDRLFAWMLRHLPFVRPDFAGVRSDDYPIRLWTVAVFSFGVLPLMKKRELDRLIIGDEYDSTQRVQHQEGMTHYNGLYDQSRFFDEAMSRFFLKKGWGIQQFSLLRPLSELLIQKILVERYPLLQAQQVSCHAAHERDGRIYPCGRCEKCRRIVGMLTALQADPHRAGYNDEQIATALRSLENAGVKQIGSDADHLFYLLKEQGALQGKAAEKARPHPEIMHLRFDRERSPCNGIPLDLRQPLFEIFCRYAEGTLRRVNRRWVPVNTSEDPDFLRPNPFELEPPSSRQALPHWVNGQYEWALLTWQESEERLKQTDIALLPVGAIEQHGPHLPLDIDAFDANFLAHKVAQACSDPKPLVLPLVPYGVSYHHQDFKGTISIRNESMSQFIYDIGISAARNGVKKLIIINGHGDNAPALSYAAQMINRDAGIFVCVDTGETSDVDIAKLTETPNDIHAGEVETSTTLAIRPELVQMDKAFGNTLQFSNRYLDFSSENSVPWYVQTSKISKNGVMGDPNKASAAKGRRIWKIMIAHLVAFVEELKALSMEEIYQRRY